MWEPGGAQADGRLGQALAACPLAAPCDSALVCKGAGVSKWAMSLVEAPANLLALSGMCVVGPATAG